jgi:hypothetical protein
MEWLMLIDMQEIVRRLGYHPANENTARQHDAVRHQVIGLMMEWNRTLPDGREKALAFTEIQAAMMWAHAAIAGGPEGSPVPEDGTKVQPVHEVGEPKPLT